MPSPTKGRRTLFAVLFSILTAILLVTAGPSTASAHDRYLGCLLGNGSYWYILIESFGGVDDAVHHCIRDLNGHPFRLEKS
jgi:hypothetical protein